MKTSVLTFCIALSTIALAANMSADQQLGAQVYTRPAFGYGKLVMTVKPTTEKGMINGFFMLKYNSPHGWPQGWTEVDYEYVPGNRQAWRRTTDGNCGPGGNSCMQSQLGGQSAANFISINIIGGPADGGPKPDSQVFYQAPGGVAYFETFNTYTIEYIPNQVIWTASGINNNKPFMYQDPGNTTADIHQSDGLKYFADREMYIWLNCYSGLGNPNGFAGPDVPTTDTEMVVKNVAFYPLVGCDNGNCTFATTPSMSSDFVNGKYTLTGVANPAFNDIWVNQDFLNNPIYTVARHANVVPGKGLVLSYTYKP